LKSRPAVPYRTRTFDLIWSVASDCASVGDELAVDPIREPSLQTADRFHRCLRGGELASVVGTARGVVTQLDDRSNVQDVVHPPVPGA